MFHVLAKKVSCWLGSPVAIAMALLFVVGWLMSGTYFHFSDTWQLIINTSTSVITFLMVFLIQNTQNRDSEMIQIKLNELIKANKKASNSLINLDDMSDKQLQYIEKRYKNGKKKPGATKKKKMIIPTQTA